jgi:hypothetical protein
MGIIFSINLEMLNKDKVKSLTDNVKQKIIVQPTAGSKLSQSQEPTPSPSKEGNSFVSNILLLPLLGGVPSSRIRLLAERNG